MGKKLVIVESPGKVRTIQKYLGPGYIIKASVGHCYQIDPKDGAIDTEHNYTPRYVIAPKKSGVVKQLKALAQTVDEIFIASDPDREGEAIGWHLAHRTLKKLSITKRIIFHEITKSAVQAALKNPTTLNEDLYHAQQARAVLDRLVGYKVSPVLWRKVSRGTSAGRVQSIGLKLIVERQKEIDAFIPDEYWTIIGLFTTEGHDKLEALYVPENKITNKEQATAIKQQLDGYADKWPVSNIENKQKKRAPYPVFNTSSLQQFCSSYFGWDGKKTMKIAQDLYEGSSIKGQEATGLITYHRTDSTNISKEALDAVRPLITNIHGSAYLPPSPRVYKTKAKSAQEAHEGIRPTHLEYTPADVKAAMSPDHGRLYEAVYKRFVACQMTDALFDSTKITIQAECAKHTFQTTGQVLKFDGFLKVWTYATNKDAVLPEVKKGERLTLVATTPEQHFTKPPSTYNTASLVKTLEEKGIGRPSTYAGIVDTLIKRQYATKEGKAFRPTALGTQVCEFLQLAFPELMDLGYTARIEDQLDDIANSQRVWYQAVDDFYKELRKRLEASKAIKSTKTVEETNITCPTCKKHKLVKRRGRYGVFYGCAGYSEKGKNKCKATFEIESDGSPMPKKQKQYLAGITCEKCDGKIVIRTSKKSGKEFGGCENYPKCSQMYSMDGMPIEPNRKRRFKRSK